MLLNIYIINIVLLIAINSLFQSDDSIRFWDYGSSSNDIDLQTTRLFRDVNAWYHIVLAIDTTQGTASIELNYM